MSIEAVNQFMQKVSEDTSLQSELAKVSGSQTELQNIIDLGGKYGYEFTPEELSKEIQSRQSASQQSDGEISEKELEAVAGGITPIGAIFLTKKIFKK
ncbi:MAG: Nif11-like leader peptide family natural product precursor [Xenococcaceae cyanobacterium]